VESKLQRSAPDLQIDHSKFDSLLADLADSSDVIDEHGRQYGKEAVPAGRIDSQANSDFGGVQTIIFNCE
jgi:hypothetical protein